MGLKAADYALLAGQLGGGLLGGMFAPEGQERQSFEGTDVSPLAMMRQSNALAGDLGKALAGRAAGGVNLPSAYAQQPGSYSGGGLPMPIGVVASDPALANPSMLSLAGLEEFRDLFGGGTGPGVIGQPDGPSDYTPPFDGEHPQDESETRMPGFDPPTTTDGSEPRDDNAAEAVGTRGTRRRSRINDGEYGQLVRASDLGADSGDDLAQGIGSVELLLEAFGARR